MCDAVIGSFYADHTESVRHDAELIVSPRITQVELLIDQITRPRGAQLATRPLCGRWIVSGVI